VKYRRNVTSILSLSIETRAFTSHFISLIQKGTKQKRTDTFTIRQYVPARTANRLHNAIQKFRTPKKHSSLIPYNADSRPGYGSRIKIHTVVSLCPGIETRPKTQRVKLLLLNIQPHQRNSEITNPLSRIDVVY